MTTKTLVYSYSNLNTYTNCAYQFYRRYVVKDVPFPDTPQIRYGNLVHTAFKDRLKDNKQFKGEAHSLQKWETIVKPLTPPLLVEAKLGMTRDGGPAEYWNGAYLRGQLDCVKYTETRAYMFDWKTGNVREKPFELAVGAMLLKANYPKLEVIFGRYVWLKEEAKLGREYDLSDTTATNAECNIVAERIQTSFTQNRWDKNPTPLCAWCEVRDCEYNRNND